jgi:hypothetical protein
VTREVIALLKRVDPGSHNVETKLPHFGSEQSLQTALSEAIIGAPKKKFVDPRNTQITLSRSGMTSSFNEFEDERPSSGIHRAIA